jgi:hypothetical protein
MKQKVSFNSSTDIPFLEALASAKLSFPDTDFSSVKTAVDLEDKINSIGQTLYVEIDTDGPVNAALANEAALKDETAKQVDSIECEIPPPVFTEADLNMDFCEVPQEFPDPIVIQPSDLDTLLAELKKIEDANASDVTDVLNCVSNMSSISSDISALNDQERNIKTAYISLEELLYNYRIMEAYYRKRVETLDQILGVFDPLLTQKRTYETQIANMQPSVLAAQDSLTKAKENLKAGTDTQTHVDELQALLDSISAPYLEAQSKLKDVTDKIEFNQGKISPFLNEIDFEKSDTFAGLSLSEKDEARLKWLNENTQSFFNGSTSSFAKISDFSSRTSVFQNIKGGSFDLTIEFTLVDPGNVLSGKSKSYAQSHGHVFIKPTQNGVTPGGTLYTRLYNIWGDIDKFFSRGERGLSPTSNSAAPQNDISNNDKYRAFYENFNANHTARTDQVKSTVIEPALQTLTRDLEDAALKEVEFLLAYGKAFSSLPAEDVKLQGVIETIRLDSEANIGVITELRNDLAFLDASHKAVLDSIEKKKQEYQQVPCAGHTKSLVEKDPVAPGSDPLGVDMQNISPEDPDPTKFCYWVKFAALATAVNILPIPGPGGFRYWPIGLIIPTPAGTVNIPLPIIWIPLAAIVLPVGIFVIFIGQCGICPSPFVLFIGMNGEKKFIVSLRPTQDFGANASEGIIKVLEKGGLAINTAISSMINKINIPGFTPITNPDSKETILGDLKDKILKNILKLGTPDITPITSRLTTHSTISDKKSAFKEVVMAHLNKMTISDIKVPKNGSNVNPKLPPVSEIVGQLTSMFKMNLPNIAIPPGSTVNLKDKLVSKVSGLKSGELPNTAIPPIDLNTATNDESNKWAADVKNFLKKGISVAHLKITPLELGLIAGVALGGVTFINPYKCKPGTTGISTPPLSPDGLVGLGAVLAAAFALIEGMSLNQLRSALVNSGGALTAAILPATLAGILKALPDVNIPNPSKISVKDLMKDSSLKLAKMQLPSLPDASKPPQIQIPIPGDAMKSTLITSVSKTIDGFPINDIDFSNITPVDMKMQIVGLVESSFTPVENQVDPILKAISGFQSAKDKGFPEILGLKKVSVDHSVVPLVTPQAMAAAIVVLKKLALVPYPAVAFTPEAFKHLHPILNSDDIPPWSRLTLENFLFVVFLDQFCSQGKKGGGLLENP